MIDNPDNLIFMELTEGIIKDYFNSPLEQKANYYGEVDVNKLIYFSKILAHCGNLILINQAFSWKNLGKNIDLIEKTIGRDYIKIANCIFKMQLLPIKEEIPDKVLDYLINNYDYLLNMSLNDCK